MNRKVVMSKRAQIRLDKLLNYLETHWSEKVKWEFVKRLDERLDIIKKSPDSFPTSSLKKGLHKCVVTKQITFFYTYNSQLIRIVNIFDTRQHPRKLLL